MDSMSTFYYLKKVFPEFYAHHDMDHDMKTILNSDADYETKNTRALSHFFKKKRIKGVANATLDVEAKYINKLFPSQKLKTIVEQLELFKDMPNRKEIVVRLLVWLNETKNTPNAAPAGTKRSVPNGQIGDHIKNNTPVKIRKMIDLPFKPLTSVNHNHFTNVKLMSKSEKSSVNGKVNISQTTAEDLTLSRSSWPPSTITTVTSTTLNPQEVDKNISVTSSTTVSNQRDNSLFNDQLPVTRPQINVIADARIAPDWLQSVKPSTVTSTMTSSSQIYPDFMNTWEFDEDRNPFNFYNPPVFDKELPVASNCTLGLGDNEDLAPVKVEFLDFSNLIQREIKDELITYDPVTSTDLLDVKVEEKPIINSLDSDQTEVYDVPELKDIEDNAVSSASNYTVSMVGPTSFKIHLAKNLVHEPTNNVPILNIDEPLNEVPALDNGVTVKEEVCEVEGVEVKNEPDLEVPNPEYVVPPVETPSTSKQQTPENTNAGEANFDLVKYLKEVTDAPDDVIKSYCKKYYVNIHTKPGPKTISILVDTILTNSVESPEDDGSIDCDFYDSLFGNVDDLDDPSTPPSTPPKQKIEDQSKIIVAKVEPIQSESSNNFNKQLVNHLCSIFPDACPTYIKGLCQDKAMNNETLDELITVILNLNNEYPKRPQRAPEPEVVPENQFEILKEFLPDADPDYLRMMCDKFEGNAEQVKTFINNAMERRDYPKMKDYLRRQQLSAQQKQYTTEFNVENFIKVIPDPESFFSDRSRLIKLDASASHYALVFLRNTFNKIQLRTIQALFNKNNANLYKTYQELKFYMLHNSSFLMRSVRKQIEMPANIQNIPLLQEIAYFTHEKEILQYLEEKKQKEEEEREEVKKLGLMKTCSCCYDEEVLPKDIFRCDKGCEFCRACIVKGTEVRFGEGKLDFPCLMNCESSFSLQTLQAVLSPKLFSKIAQKKALEEIKSAGINELEMCPFCDFATIPAEGYNIFTCMNPDCMKESCRMCKEPSHIPLRCDEIEKDEDIRARTFVENKMTEALLRKCWKCGVKFFKEEGCNKMTCSCGAQMCYVCNQPVKSYAHFNGNGGDRHDLCPLYSDTHILNKENVLKGAAEAKAKIGNVNLKHDPTSDVQQHYQDRRKKYPQQHLLVGQQPPPPQVVGPLVIRMRDIFERRYQQHQHPPF